jgi:holliday junction DNA helicase RuvA
MISYIKGEITFKSPTHIIVENNGIGYHLNISLATFSKIETAKEVKMYVHAQIKEDTARSFVEVLYGFAEESEREMFMLLTSVSGVGYNTARLMLSAMSVDEIKLAIVQENVVAINKIKGIGPKTAKQIILDLKDKVAKTVDAANLQLSALLSDHPSREEAISALVALGFVKINVQKAINRVLKENPDAKTVEDLIKQGLKVLS